MARAKKSRKPDPKPAAGAEKPVEAASKSAMAVIPQAKVDSAIEPGSEVQHDVSPKPTVQAKSGAGTQSIWPMFLGGAIVAAFGFLAAQYFGEDRWPFASAPSLADENLVVIDAHGGRIVALETQISELTQALAGLASADVTGDLGARLDDILQAMRERADLLEVLDRRMGDLESRPIPDGAVSNDAVEAYSRELTAMRQMFEAELARVKTAQENVQKTETNAAKRAEIAIVRQAISRVQTALDLGAPLDQELAALKEAGIDMPAYLKSISRDGVASLAELQREFPAAARDALAVAVKADVAAGRENRLIGFLRSQLGARSLGPKQGSDADAILSRAEAALSTGDLDQSLDELSNLPAAGAARMSVWMEMALGRQRAVAAVAALAEILEK